MRTADNVSRRGVQCAGLMRTFHTVPRPGVRCAGPLRTLITEPRPGDNKRRGLCRLEKVIRIQSFTSAVLMRTLKSELRPGVRGAGPNTGLKK